MRSMFWRGNQSAFLAEKVNWCSPHPPVPFSSPSERVPSIRKSAASPASDENTRPERESLPSLKVPVIGCFASGKRASTFSEFCLKASVLRRSPPGVCQMKFHLPSRSAARSPMAAETSSKNGLITGMLSLGHNLAR